MTVIVFFLAFFFSIAAATGAILLSIKLKASFSMASFESLFYYVILFSIFGFYGIWGAVITQYVLSVLNASSPVVQAIGHLVPLLGFPFLMMGGYMLIKSGYELFNEQLTAKNSVIFFVSYLLILIIFGWYGYTDTQFIILDKSNPVYLLLCFYTVQDLMISLWYLLKGLGNSVVKKSRKEKRTVLWYLLTFAVLLIFKFVIIVLIFFLPVLIPVFILIYFLSIVLPVFYLYLRSEKFIYEAKPGYTSGNTRERLIKKYGISPREKEIVDLICSGKSNQEIADLLFITLQTVKDHTHRIYFKMDVKSRIQLITAFQNAK